MSGVPLSSDDSPRYRNDIDGLRAVAVLLVIAYHLGVSQISGGFVGVDVFFVISGFLITGLLVSEYQRTGTLSLRQFWARRARRLLPLAALVIMFTLLASFVLQSPLMRRESLLDGASAVLYIANFRFAETATTYTDVSVTDSLFLHFWSLAVEEQFYIVWPLLFLLVAALSKRWWRQRSIVALGGAVAVLTVTSFVATLVWGPTTGAAMYYLPHFRFWELGVGAILAMVVSSLQRLPLFVVNLAGLVGLVAVAGSALVIDHSTVFPGPATLVPVLGAAFVLGSAVGHRTVVSRLLSIRPATYIGRISYGLYLWHWPVIGISLLAHDKYGWDWSNRQVLLGALIATFVLASATHHLVENPVRYSKALKVSLSKTAVTAAIAMLAPLAMAGTYLLFGDTGQRTSDASLAMTPQEAQADKVSYDRKECQENPAISESHQTCSFAASKDRPRVAIIGDSHADHWVPALERAGALHDWEVITFMKSACTPYDVPISNRLLEREYPECGVFVEEVLKELESRGTIDILIVSRSLNYAPLILAEDDAAKQLAWEEGARTRLTQMTSIAGRVVIFEGTPWASQSIPDCFASAASPEDCAIDLSVAFRGLDLLEAEKRGAPPSVEFLNVTPLICDSDPCSMVTESGIIKYRDRHHLTQTFSRSLGEELAELLGLFGDTGQRTSDPSLAMTPQEAQADKVSYDREECQENPAISESHRTCSFAASKDRPRVAIIGDSHADHWVPALEQAGALHDWEVITFMKSACTPYDVPISNRLLEREYPECGVFVEEVLKELESRGTIDILIVSRSLGYAPVILAEDDAAKQLAWEEGARTRLTQMTSIAGRVVVFEGTPWAKQSIPDCFASAASPEDCAIDLSVAFKGLDLLAAEKRAAPPSVEFIDVAGLVCDSDPCSTVTESGLIKYRDSHHLTQTFSRSLGEELAELLGMHR